MRRAGGWHNGVVANRTPQARKWLPTSQPQTLQIGVWLLYWNAFLGIVAILVSRALVGVSLALVVAEVAGGYGIANERKWGYFTAVGAAVAFLVFEVGTGGASLLFVLFQLALIVLLLHPLSRSYYKIWFR